MASKKTESKKAKPQAPKKPAKAASKTVKAAPKVKAPPVAAGPRHPRGKLQAAHESKEALAKKLAATLARADEDADVIAARLRTASNRQLLRLASVTETVKKKWGSREKLIAAIGAAKKKSKDQDFLTRLDTYSLPYLVELATTAARHSRA
jgi:hypothetical protein